jgi:hypothetical protein
MKDNLRSACLLFLVFIIFTAGFVSLVSAKDPDPYSFNESNYTGKWKNLDSPTSEYSIWGYKNTNYTFITHCSNKSTLDLKENPEIVFYWSCNNNTDNPSDNKVDPSNFTRNPINNTTYYLDSWNCTNKWNETGTYYVSVATYQNKSVVNVSYWVPIKIINDTKIEVKNFFMVDENKKYDCNNNSTNNSNIRSQNYSIPGDSNKTYCAYAEKTHYFLAELNATLADSNLDFQRRADLRTVTETTTEVNWSDGPNDYNSYDKSTNVSSNDTSYQWSENFTHRWDTPGNKTIYVSNYHWDPLSGKPRYSKNNSNVSILIIRDPKNFFFDSNSLIKKSFSNLQNMGLFLVTIGLMVLFFVFTKNNNVPVKIALLGLKPFDLKSVDYFIGIFSFIAGMYLYFVFGRCPWDIPMISYSQGLQNAYFIMLYYEYTTPPNPTIPYLSILLGLVVVFFSSTILYHVGLPILNKLKSVKFLIIKGISMLRLSISRFSLQFKEFSIQMKENIRIINVNNGKVTGLQSESGKKEKM